MNHPLALPPLCGVGAGAPGDWAVCPAPPPHPPLAPWGLYLCWEGLPLNTTCPLPSTCCQGGEGPSIGQLPFPPRVPVCVCVRVGPGTRKEQTWSDGRGQKWSSGVGGCGTCWARRGSPVQSLAAAPAPPPPLDRARPPSTREAKKERSCRRSLALFSLGGGFLFLGGVSVFSFTCCPAQSRGGTPPRARALGGYSPPAWAGQKPALPVEPESSPPPPPAAPAAPSAAFSPPGPPSVSPSL